MMFKLGISLANCFQRAFRFICWHGMLSNKRNFYSFSP